MKLKHLLKTSFLSLKANKTRAFLTVLGIVIGIASIIMIVSVGKGAENLIMNELGSMGADMIVIRPGQEPKGPTDFAESIFSNSLKNRDVVALKKKSNVPYLIEAVPAVLIPGSSSYRGETFKSFNFGWSAEFMKEMFDTQLEVGNLFTETDIKNKATVVVIGSKVKKELFGDSDALGRNIRIKNTNFRVVGVLAPRGQVSFLNVDELVVIPYTTAQTYLMGIDYYNEIIVRAKSPDLVEQTVKDVQRVLRENHGITDPSKDDFFVVTQQGLADQVGVILGVLTIFLSMVVAISLVVGGVGVMNIMLVSVTERTKEIGLRKAIGATDKDIMLQFLFEAVIITVAGGIIGIIIGALLSLLTSIILTTFFSLYWPFSFSIPATLMSLAVALIVGLVFGIYPAKQAAKRSPIEALRYE